MSALYVCARIRKDVQYDIHREPDFGDVRLSADIVASRNVHSNLRNLRIPLAWSLGQRSRMFAASRASSPHPSIMRCLTHAYSSRARAASTSSQSSTTQLCRVVAMPLGTLDRRAPSRALSPSGVCICSVIVSSAGAASRWNSEGSECRSSFEQTMPSRRYNIKVHAFSALQCIGEILCGI